LIDSYVEIIDGFKRFNTVPDHEAYKVEPINIRHEFLIILTTDFYVKLIGKTGSIYACVETLVRP
jgi:hypothetical protein